MYNSPDRDLNVGDKTISFPKKRERQKKIEENSITLEQAKIS